MGSGRKYFIAAKVNPTTSRLWLIKDTEGLGSKGLFEAVQSLGAQASNVFLTGIKFLFSNTE